MSVSAFWHIICTVYNINTLFYRTLGLIFPKAWSKAIGALLSTGTSSRCPSAGTCLSEPQDTAVKGWRRKGREGLQWDTPSSPCLSCQKGHWMSVSRHHKRHSCLLGKQRQISTSLNDGWDNSLTADQREDQPFLLLVVETNWWTQFNPSDTFIRNVPK